MSPTLTVCDGFALNLSDYAQKGLRVGIWASSGRGKSFGVGVFCEELLGAGIPVVAIDPEGELHTLREQYRVLVLGGEQADLPLPAGKLGVRLALERALDEGLGLVLDLSDRPTTRAQQQAALPWLEALWVLLSERRAPAALVVEEVHIFAPQSGVSLCADMMQRFAKQGRKRGAVLVAASQRTQAVSKEFMSQLNFPAIGGFETERDYEAVKAVVDGHPFEQFRSLEPGCFYLPAASGFYRWRPRRTAHGGEAPSWAPSEAVETAARDAGLDALVEQLRLAFEQETSTPPDPGSADRLRIRELERKLGTTEASLAEAKAEITRLHLALQVASLVKVVIQQEVISRAPALAAPVASTAEVVKLEARPVEPSLVKDVKIHPDRLLELEPVKSMIRRARDRARRRSSRSPEYMHAAVRTLAGGSVVSPAELAARYGYYGQVTVNRMGHALSALAEVGFATLHGGQYRLNEQYLRQVIVHT